MSERRLRSNEDASALTLAIIVMVLGGIVSVAIFGMLQQSGERNRSRTDRAANVAVIDRATAAYEYALESNLTNDYHVFRLNQAAMRQLAASESGSSGGEAIRNSSFGARFREHGLERTWMPAAYAWSMSTPVGDGRVAWWQLVNTIPPGPGSASLVAYIRTWVSSGAAGSRVLTEPRIARVELRPGRFSDYQMLVDGPLVLGAGTLIRGRVHTNGYPDAYLVDAFTRPNEPLVLGSSSGLPRCERGAGFSTARGTIRGGCTGFAAPRDENNGRLIDLLRGKSHLSLLASMCGSVVYCPASASPNSINLNTGTVNGRSIPGSVLAVYVRGDTDITGSTTRNITIGVDGRANVTTVFGSASLSLRGNGAIGARNPDSPTGGTVGLVVDGDIIPRFDAGSCPTAINAAMVSTSGALTMPAQFRVPEQPDGNPPTCNSLRIHGSLGTHYAPLLYLRWGSAEAGYRNRTYDYDARFRTNPPPLFPLTGPWQVTSWKDAIPECLTAARRTEADCG